MLLLNWKPGMYLFSFTPHTHPAGARIAVLTLGVKKGSFNLLRAPDTSEK